MSRPDEKLRRHAALAVVILGIALATSGIAFFGWHSIPSVRAGNPPRQSETASGTMMVDDLQRSTKILRYQVLADSGPARGENIYYFKCWMCHNRYTKSAPYLKDLFNRSTMVSGQPVNDQSVEDQIKKGSAGMPSFGTTMSDQDLADLMSYLKTECCYEGESAPPVNPWYKASTTKWSVPDSLTGGPTGAVKIPSGESLAQIKVQLVAPNGVKTTVYTDAAGNYEFPKMQAGSYTLRIATPLEYKPYRRDSVQINGTTKLDDIVLERVSNTEYLPPTPEIEGQLSAAEWLWNLSGTDQEKDTFRRACGPGCHNYQQIFRNRYDERSWGLIVHRMLHYGGAPLINPEGGAPDRGTLEGEKIIVKWLARVRGPDSKDPPFRVFPRTIGPSTRVVVTEYELPHALDSTHDVYGDSHGNVWYTSHRTPYAGVVDSHTGVVTEYALPITPDALPGTHHVVVGKDGIVYFSENWSHKLAKFDPKTKEFTEVTIASPAPINSPGFSNFALAPDGYIWSNSAGEVQKIDPKTGNVLARYPFKPGRSYDNTISWDGNFWAGGSPAGSNGNSAEMLDIRTGKMLELNTGTHLSNARRGGFDPFGNAWFGGGGGSFVEINAKERRIEEFWPETPYIPYTDFYEAMPDKNGDVWGGVLHGRGFVRYSPKTGRWVEYVLPEPFAHDRRTWIDNSTNPVSVWYTDYTGGEVIRIQPLE